MAHSVNEEMNNLGAREKITIRRKRNQPPLSGLLNPTREFLQANYTNAELQKHCAHLKLTGIWIPKEQLIDKLMTYYSTIDPSPSVSSLEPITVETNQVRVSGESRITELIERFNEFVRETKDNFYVINNTLVEKDK